MLAHDALVPEQLAGHQPQRYGQADRHAEHSGGPEKMRRPIHVFEQEANGDEIEEDPERPGNAVMRRAFRADDVLDRNLADGSAILRSQCGNEAMQFAIQWHLLDNLAPIGLIGRAEIVNGDAAEFVHGPVCDARGQAAHHEIVDALLAPSADQIVTLLQLFEECRNIVGIVLQIAIHGDDELALSVGKTGRQRGCLPEVAPQTHHHHPAVDGHDLAQQFVGAVDAAVIHKDQFEGISGGLHNGLEPVVQRGYAFLLIVERNDNGILRHTGRLYNLYKAQFPASYAVPKTEPRNFCNLSGTDLNL